MNRFIILGGGRNIFTRSGAASSVFVSTGRQGAAGIAAGPYTKTLLFSDFTIDEGNHTQATYAITNLAPDSVVSRVAVSIVEQFVADGSPASGYVGIGLTKDSRDFFYSGAALDTFLYADVDKSLSQAPHAFSTSLPLTFVVTLSGALDLTTLSAGSLLIQIATGGQDGAQGERGPTGATGPAGTVTNKYIAGETPSGDIDGVNDTFILAETPALDSNGNPAIMLFLNNGKLRRLVDFSMSDATITFLTFIPPQIGDSIEAYYYKA